MKAPAILPAGVACNFVAYATLQSGAVKRLEFTACNQPEALSIAFALSPGATAVSVRRADRDAPRDALADLHRRAGEVPQ